MIRAFLLAMEVSNVGVLVESPPIFITNPDKVCLESLGGDFWLDNKGEKQKTLIDWHLLRHFGLVFQQIFEVQYSQQFTSLNKRSLVWSPCAPCQKGQKTVTQRNTCKIYSSNASINWVWMKGNTPIPMCGLHTILQCFSFTTPKVQHLARMELLVMFLESS